jgi:5-(carboxyamino)imidazole ribonucleotide mutase
MTDVIIIMGSKSDQSYATEIAKGLERFDLSYTMRVASAHKSPTYLLQILHEYEETHQSPHVYITIAGRSNALSGMVDAAVAAPVIACPPYSDRFGGVDVYSSLRMPSGVAPALILEPGGAALLAAKILGRREQVRALQMEQTSRLIEDDRDVEGVDATQ